jgi:hypothetical protein
MSTHNLQEVDAMSARRCFDCGANTDQAVFGRRLKPAGKRDRCLDCTANPDAGFRLRVSARLEEIAALRAAGAYRPQRTAPLFAGLRVSARGR